MLPLAPEGRRPDGSRHPAMAWAGKEDYPSQAAVGRARPGSRCAEGVTGNKIVTVAARREAVQLLVARGLSPRRACFVLQLPRPTLGYQARPDRNAELATQVHALAHRHPRSGYRRVWAVLRRRGQHGNQKPGPRLWTPAKRQVRKVTR